MDNNSSKIDKSLEVTQKAIVFTEDKDAEVSSTEKQDKFLRLLGGKKEKNVGAASEWISRSRSSDEEKRVQKGLENQYNASLNLRLTGKVRRHEGIGFEQQALGMESAPHVKDLVGHDCHHDPFQHKSSPTHRRSRSRSPIKSEKGEKITSTKPSDFSSSGATSTDSKDNKDTAHVKPINKKNFYMQFAKAKDAS